MKKYVPSGYQIINIDLTGRTAGTGWEPSTEDEKILHDLLVKNGNGEIVKPILLYVKNHHMSGFPVLVGNLCSLSRGYVGGQTVLDIFVNSDDELEIDYNED